MAALGDIYVGGTLKERATYLQCSRCGRKSWDAKVNEDCNFPQPDGTRCKGIMEGKKE